MVKQIQPEGVAFFALRLEVWTIGDSEPAVQFTAIEEPSEWKAKASRSNEELSDRARRREEFWTLLRNRIETRDTPLRSRKPHPKSFYSNPIGKGGFHMSFVANPSEECLTVEESFRTMQRPSGN